MAANKKKPAPAAKAAAKTAAKKAAAPQKPAPKAAAKPVAKPAAKAPVPVVKAVAKPVPATRPAERAPDVLDAVRAHVLKNPAMAVVGLVALLMVLFLLVD